MRIVLRILVLLLLVSSCKETVQKPDGYVVEGNAKDVYNGVRVYLKAYDANKREVVRDTAIVMNEKFKFTGKLEIPEMQHLTINSVKGVLPIFVENNVIHVDIDKENLADSKITGTKNNEVLASYSKTTSDLMKKRLDLVAAYQTAKKNNDEDEASALQTKSMAMNKLGEEYPFQFIEEHPDSYISLSIAENILKGNNSNFDKAVESYNSLNDEVKSSPYGKSVNILILSIKAEREEKAALEMGKVAPNFSAPSTDGSMLSLNAIKGKATIIDFWASWCKPCRMENPNVVKVYNKYHDKGLEIISISLDRPGQKDRWLKAIQDDKMTWHHVSNLQYFNDPIAQLYQISSIPATYILDSEGKIVAKKLRGQALEDKIAEMLK